MSNRPSSLDSLDDQRLARLGRLIEAEIIPRLLICHTVTGRPPVADDPAGEPVDDPVAAGTVALNSADVAELARLMLEPQREFADAYLESISLRGASRGLICAELLAPTAKRLGELWERDECDFAALTAGLERLESVLNDFRGSLV